MSGSGMDASAAATRSPLDRERLERALTTAWLGRSLEVLTTTGSTMDEARRAALAGARDGHAILADAQTRGRGSRGRPWASPAGEDLYLSFILRPSLPPEHLSTLTLAVGLGVAAAVRAWLTEQTPVGIKWPNDVLVRGRKIAGILVETLNLEVAFVGVGLNVNRRLFEPALRGEATSLAIEGGASLDRPLVAARLLLEIERAIDLWNAGDSAAIVPRVEEVLLYRGERVRVAGRIGKLRGLARDGALRLELEEETIEVRSGQLERLEG